MIKLLFETLTPIHISNGNQLAYNLEYIVADGYLAKLNPFKASKALADARLFDFNRNYKFDKIIKIIEQNKNLFDDNDFDYKIYSEVTFLDYIKNKNRDGRKIVQEFINSNGRFYVPGSSIKGMLTTILNRDVDRNPLGINPNNPTMNDKFVITDSNFIDEDNFVVHVANRPPSVNLIVLDAGVNFNSSIRKLGNLTIDVLRKKLAKYSFKQRQKAKTFVTKFKNLEPSPKGAIAYYNVLEKILNELNKLDDEEYLVNIGFGGGSYYKIFDNVPVPKFPSKKFRNSEEEAHTTFTVQIENEQYQLGWCKLKIEEL